MMAFPNQLNQMEVIKLANRVVPDLSITFERNQHDGYYRGQAYQAFDRGEQQVVNVNQTSQWDNRERQIQGQSQFNQMPKMEERYGYYLCPCYCYYCRGY